jgi:hypothetical protein
MSQTSLSQIANSDNYSIIDYFQNRDLLHKQRYCPKCYEDGGQRVRMKICERNDVADGHGWRCSKCTKRISLRKDTFFENFKLSFRVLVSVIIHWAIQSRQMDTAQLTECHRTSIASFQQRLRTVASRAADQANTVIGGPGRVVEIDESLYIKVMIYLCAYFLQINSIFMKLIKIKGQASPRKRPQASPGLGIRHVRETSGARRSSQSSILHLAKERRFHPPECNLHPCRSW